MDKHIRGLVRFVVETVAAIVLGNPVWRLMDMMWSTPVSAWLNQTTAMAILALAAICLILWDLTRGLRGKWGTPVMETGPPERKKATGPLYRTLDELPPLAPMFAAAKSSLTVFAMDAGLLTTKYIDDLRSMLLSGKFVRFLLLDPNSKFNESLEGAWPMNEPFSTVVGSLDRISRLKNDLPSDLRSHLEIRYYDLLPIHTMMVFDHASENPTMQVTLYRYNSLTWSYLKFSKREEPDLFDKYWQSYKYAESKSWEPGEVHRPS